MHRPDSLESARGYRYDRWSGNPKGTAFDPERCYVEIQVGGWLVCQCPNKEKYDGLCGTHRNQLERQRKAREG